MFYKEHINTIESFVSKLQDEESISLYDARLKYYFDRDENLLEEKISILAEKYKESFFCGGLYVLYDRRPEKRNARFVIYGAGLFGKETNRTLKALNKKVVGYVDGDPEYYGNEIEGLDRIELHELVTNYSDCVVIIATKRLYQLNIYYKLINIGVKEDNIFMHQEGGLYFDYGNQYFDVEQVYPNAEGEIFVDAGCYDGLSSAGAMRWANGNLKKIYAFEPDVNNLIACEECLNSLGCEYELYNVASWSEKTELSFDINMSAGYGSKVSKNGISKVSADSIDNVLSGNRVTYIKMDDEGSELETLNGAINTIMKYRPKMAISIYHKPEDILEIPAFLEKLGVDYKYYIRQYQTRKCEMTLYCV